MGLLTFLKTPAPMSKDIAGRFDIVGDVHGQADALVHLMRTAGWCVPDFDRDGYAPIRAHHPEGRHLVFVGDLVNKGPDSLIVLRLLLGMQGLGTASAVMGNHEDMLLAALRSPKAKAKKSVRQTRKALLAAPATFRRAVEIMLARMPLRLALPMPKSAVLSGAGTLHILHAGARPADLRRMKAGTRQRLVHGTGLSTSRKSGWARAFDGAADWIVHGHTPSSSPRVAPRVIGLDTGAGGGKKLTMLRADSASFLSVQVALTPKSGAQLVRQPPVFRSVA